MNAGTDSTAAIHGRKFSGLTFHSNFHGMHARETC